MTLARLSLLVAVVLTVFAVPAGATDGIQTPHRVLLEDISEHRRQVSVRIERRLAEAELMRLGDALRSRQTRPFPRTVINFFLPGQDVQQGAWASLAYTTESKLTINGLRREDEDVLTAESLADKRHLLGAWLTSPPAALGRLTIFSDAGKIYGEWRLRSGQRTVDELIDVSSRSERRFEVPGGSTYVLTRSGDLEIREKTALVAVAERIRPHYLALPASVALGAAAPTTKTAAVLAATPAPAPTSKPFAAALASPAQPEPAAAAPAGPAVPAGPRIALPAAGETSAVGQPVVTLSKPKRKVHAADKGREPKNRSAKNGGENTPGDQIASKLGRL